MDEDCEWWMKHLPVFIGALWKHFSQGLPSKEASLSKDEEGKHLKTKRAEISLPIAFRFCFKFTPSLYNSASVNCNEISVIWKESPLNELQHPLNETKNALNQ